MLGKEETQGLKFEGQLLTGKGKSEMKKKKKTQGDSVYVKFENCIVIFLSGYYLRVLLQPTGQLN
jgi:hypothetical protein